MANIYLTVNGSKTGISISKADTFLSKFLGLMGKTNVATWLYIEHCSSIHTFFMKVPIDAIFMDRSGRVVKVIPNLKPWKVVLPVPDAWGTLELASGSASQLNLKLNDMITLE